MRLFRAVLFAGSFLLIPGSGNAGSASTPPSGSSATLQVTAEAETPFSGGLAGRAKCDDAGNIYFRSTGDIASQNYHPISSLPIREVGLDGRPKGLFSLKDVSQGLLAIDFYVAGDGSVYQAARSESERAVYVIAYTANGTFRSKVRVQGEFFVPYQIAVFPSGEILLSGIHGAYNRTPFTAVYREDGKLIKEIYEPEDEDARKRAEAGEPGFRPSGIESSNDFVTRGDVALGSDGNVYLLRAASPALIYVISSCGEVVRKLQVGSPDSGLWAGRLNSANRILAISFLQKDANTGMIQTVDYDGNPIASYSSTDGRTYPGLLGCFTPQRFTFLSLKNGQNLRVTTAVPK